MSTREWCAMRVNNSLHRRVTTATTLPSACFLPVIYRRRPIVGRYHAPSAGGCLPPERAGRDRLATRNGHIRDKQKDGRLPARLSVAEIAKGSVFRRLFRVVVLARLAVLALQRRAEDVAEAGARIGGAVFGHRLLLLLDLARLDRQGKLARRLVDRGDLGIDLLADGEAVGPLLGAVAREVALADEAGHAFGDHHLDPAIGDAGDRAGDDIAFLEALQRLRMRVRGELLDAEADPLLLDIDIEDLDLDEVALLVVGDRFLAGTRPVEVG